MTLRRALALLALWGSSAWAAEARIIDATVLDKVYPSEQVSDALAVSLPALGACFVAPDAGAAPRGEIAFEIGPNGKAQHVNASGDLDRACAEREAVRWRFARPTGETPQAFVTLELGASASESLAPERERAEYESFCSLVQQLQPRAQRPEELMRKALRTLLASGMTPRGERWATEMLSEPPFAQLAEFQASAAERGLRIECPEYVGWYQRTFGSGPEGTPFDLVLVASEGPILRTLLRNRSVSEQWYLEDDAVQPTELVLLDGAGRAVSPSDERAPDARSRALGRGAYRTVGSSSAVRLREEALQSDGVHASLRWGPYTYALVPGTYRAKARYRSAQDGWKDEGTGAKGTLKGVWKGTVESNEVRFTVR